MVSSKVKPPGLQGVKNTFCLVAAPKPPTQVNSERQQFADEYYYEYYYVDDEYGDGEYYYDDLGSELPGFF